MRLQFCSSAEYRLPLHCHYSQVLSDLDRLYLIWPLCVKYICRNIIYIWKDYLKPYSCIIIINSYMKWSRIIVHKILVLDRNTRNYLKCYQRTILLQIIYMKKNWKKQNNPKFDESIRKSTLNVSVVMTFFRILNSWKVLIKQQWMFDEFKVLKKVI